MLARINKDSQPPAYSLGFLRAGLLNRLRMQVKKRSACGSAFVPLTDVSGPRNWGRSTRISVDVIYAAALRSPIDVRAGVDECESRRFLSSPSRKLISPPSRTAKPER